MTDQAESERNTWYVAEESWFLRLWSWAWHIAPQKADLCRLFWGLLFVWIPLTLRAVVLLAWPIWYPLNKLLTAMARSRAARARVDVAREVRAPVVRPPRPPREHRILNWITGTAARGSMWMAGVWPKLRRLLVPLGIGLMILAGVVCLVATGYGLYLLAPMVASIPAMVWLWVLVGAVVVGAFFGGLVWLVTRYPGGPTEWYEESRPLRILLAPFRAGGRGGAGFFRIMWAGLKAVKTRTCPKVEVVPRELS